MSRQLSRLVILILILFFIYIFVSYDLSRYLTLDFLKANQARLDAFYQRKPGQVISVYMAIYILSAALSFPGATVLTLAGSALFGFWIGLVAVSFASTIGATLAFLSSRILLRDFVQRRFGAKLRAINEGIEKEGSFYLFTLRLVPIFPFFLVNLVMGLTPIRVAPFFLVSQIGMLPGTIAYVNAGTQLGKIHSFREIVSPAILVSFAILGIFPLVAKKLIEALRRSKTTRKFRKPSNYDYNLVVIGGGSAGLVTAYIAATVKAKVALVEKHKMGGDCLNTGCVPSKALIRSARMLSLARRAKEFGLREAKVEFDFAEVMERVQKVIRRIEPHDSIERYTRLGVDCIEGTARITSPYTVEAGGRTLNTKNIVIATGARPTVPGIPGLNQVSYHTTDSIWSLRKLPKRLLILGGGPIGCEMAQAFQRLGSQVTLVEKAGGILIKEDEDAARLVRERLESEGVRILTGHEAKEFSADRALICEHQGQRVRIEFDEVLLALGRTANVTGFGLEELGVRLSSRGTIEADEFLRTNYSNIYVCGDVTGPYQFTHFGAHQAWYASVNALFSPFKRFRADYRVIPWATFTDPEVARVGLNEREARGQGIRFQVTTYQVDELDRAIADSENHGFVKVLTVPGKDEILGVTIVGEHASDVIAEFVTAMKHGLGLNKILGTIHIYPTFSEANKYAAGEWKRTNTPVKAFGYLGAFHRWRRG